MPPTRCASSSMVLPPWRELSEVADQSWIWDLFEVTHMRYRSTAPGQGRWPARPSSYRRSWSHQVRAVPETPPLGMPPGAVEAYLECGLLSCPVCDSPTAGYGC